MGNIQTKQSLDQSKGADNVDGRRDGKIGGVSKVTHDFLKTTVREIQAKAGKKGSGEGDARREVENIQERESELKTQQYVEKTEYILALLPGVLEHLREDSAKEIKLGLNNEQLKILNIDKTTMYWIEQSEKNAETIIGSSSIPNIVKYLENELEKEQKKSLSDEVSFLGKDQKFLRQQIKYLILKEKTLQKQSKELAKEVEKYKAKRKVLMNLPNRLKLQSELKKTNQAFLEDKSLSPTTKQYLLEKISQNYKIKEGGQLNLTTKLAELDSETIFDKKIEELQDLQKLAAKQLGSENYEGPIYLLKSQKRETDYYSRHPNLVLLQQMGGKGCGNIATLMAAADKDKKYVQMGGEGYEKMATAMAAANKDKDKKYLIYATDKDKKYFLAPLDKDKASLAAATDRDKASLEEENQKNVARLMGGFAHLTPPGLGIDLGTTSNIMSPIVFSQINHPIEYEYFNNENISHNKWDTRNIMLPPYIQEEYYSSTGRSPRSISIEQFKHAIKQKGEEDAMIVSIITKAKDRFFGHTILVDAMETIDGEEHVIYRDPQFGKGAAVHWKDFLETWGGEVSLPRGLV